MPDSVRLSDISRAVCEVGAACHGAASPGEPQRTGLEDRLRPTPAALVQHLFPCGACVRVSGGGVRAGDQVLDHQPRAAGSAGPPVEADQGDGGRHRGTWGRRVDAQGACPAGATVGADKGYDQRLFVGPCRELGITPRSASRRRPGPRHQRRPLPSPPASDGEGRRCSFAEEREAGSSAHAPPFTSC